MESDVPAAPAAPRAGGGGWNKGVKSQIRTGLGRRPGLRNRQVAPAAAVAADDDRDSGADSSREQATNGTNGSDRVPIPAPADNNGPLTSDEEGEIHSAFSGDDEAVVINLAGDQGPQQRQQQQDHVQPSTSHGQVNGEDSNITQLSAGDPNTINSPHPPHLNGSEGKTNRTNGDLADESEEGEIDEDEQADAMSISSNDDNGENNSKTSRPQRTGSHSTALPPQPPPPLPTRGSMEHPIDIVDDDDDDDYEPANKALAADQPDADPLARHSRSREVAMGAPRKTLTLGDIPTTDLQLQLRYFHIGTDPSRIPLGTPVRCTMCSGSGHLASSCDETLVCRICSPPSSGSTPRYAFRICDTHAFDVQNNAPADAARTTCPMCGCTGHRPALCELRWRTSAWPPKAPLPALGVVLFCYECGAGGHLGNDCSARRPGKGVGTSSWSAGTAEGGAVPACEDDGRDVKLPPPPPGPDRRRGNGRRPQGAAPDEEDAGDLLRGKARLPQPNRSGSIKIADNLGKGRREGPGRASRRDGDQQPVQSGGPPGGSGQKNSNKKRKKDGGPGRGGGDSFRPMPSAAKKAYLQGRK